MKKPILTLGLYKNQLVPVTPNDLKKIKRIYSENWGTTNDNDKTLRFFPLDFLNVLIEDFIVKIIK